MNGLVNSEGRRPCTGTSSKTATRRNAKEDIRARYHDLQSLSRRGLRDLFLFFVLSVWFFSMRQVDLLTPLAEGVRELLGCPPPPELTTLALAGYTLSAFVLILARTIQGERPRLRWSHLGYRTVFYFFYAVAGSLEENFMGVLLAGLFLIGLEQLNIWTYALKTLPGRKILANKL
jgi:hypothetical protein